MPVVDKETGEYMEQEYEVISEDGSVETRNDGIGTWLLPIASLTASLSAEAGVGTPVSPGGRFRQPARAIRLVQYFNGAKSRSQERLDARRKRD